MCLQLETCYSLNCLRSCTYGLAGMNTGTPTACFFNSSGLLTNQWIWKISFATVGYLHKCAFSKMPQHKLDIHIYIRCSGICQQQSRYSVAFIAYGWYHYRFKTWLNFDARKPIFLCFKQCRKRIVTAATLSILKNSPHRMPLVTTQAEKQRIWLYSHSRDYNTSAS